MNGVLVPVVLVPRYSTYFGPAEFTTAPMNVEAYAKGTITLWRGQLNSSDSPPTAAFKAFFEDSHDAVKWTPFNSSGEDPGNGASMIVRFDLSRRWLRVRFDLDGTAAAVTCWAVGTLELRVAEGSPGA